jgi:hypothetical protein
MTGSVYGIFYIYIYIKLQVGEESQSLRHGFPETGSTFSYSLASALCC